MTSTLTYIKKHNPRLFILAGMPGCGKSTWAQTFFEPGVIISSDGIREEFYPGEKYDHNHNEEVFIAFYYRIGSRLEHLGLAVADATSLAWQARDKLLTLACFYQAEKHLIFFDNPVQALHRNGHRIGNARVPYEAQQVMLDKHRESRVAIMNEYYTSITIIEATQ
jgi:predicted kinase